MSNSKFATDGTMGVLFNASDTTPQFRLGHSVFATDNSELMYVYFPGAVTSAGYVCQVDPTTFQASMLTTANAARGAGVGVAQAAQAGGTWGWVQTYGPALTQVAASTAANAKMNTTAIPGQLGTDATVGSKQIDGLTLLVVQPAGSAGQKTGNVNGPTVGANN